MIIIFFLLFFSYWALINQILRPANGGGGGWGWGAVKFNYSLPVSAAHGNIFVAFSARKGAS